MPPSLLDLSPNALAQSMDCSLGEARRSLAWVLSHGKMDLDGMARPIKRALRERILAHYSLERPRILQTVSDPVDGSLRYLFALHDGAVVEAVRIPLQRDRTFSVCLSSQVGCAMRCDFCATGRMGLSRNLAAWEMVACWMQVREHAPGRVTGAVFMGQGEPFHNYAQVTRAAQVLSRPDGCRISAKNITISTVGLVPQIRQYTQERHPYRLIISLSSALQSRRAELLPVAAKWPVSELFEVLRERFEQTGKRTTLAWVLMQGVNHGPDEVKALAELLREHDTPPVLINLIDVNEAREQGYERCTSAERDAFIDAITGLGLPILRRYSVGAESNSACGMLASSRTRSI